ncbi:MAG: HIT domain-containing protein [Paracoccus sp. (in: a-proteobacteria)]
MGFVYDDSNIFARILRGEIPNDTVLETEHTLAFRDIQPKAPSHVLVIPKGKYVTFDDFAANASSEEITDFMRVLAQITAAEGISTGSGGQGFRAIANAGTHGLQEVPHFHLHILGGRVIGPMVVN